MRLICAYAQTHAFEPAAFDLVISRLGVLFFDDPVRAFANVRRATTDRGALRFVAWRGPSENQFLMTAERAAAPFVASLQPRQVNASGPFAFADREHGVRILEDSGWTDVDIRPIDVACTMPESELVRYVTRVGPVGRVFHEPDEARRARVMEAIRAAADPWVHASEIRFTAACWLAGASAPVRRIGWGAE